MKKIYIWTIVISIAFIIPGCFVSYPILNVLSSIGCSGIAAAIMAIFIEKHTKDQQEAMKQKARKAYFRELHEQLKILLKRIVWFDDRMKDVQFDWDKNPKEYSSLNYMLWAPKAYPEYKLSYHEISERLSKIANQYSLEQQEKMNLDAKIKMCKMFNILGVSGTEILRQIEIIDENKLVLDNLDYMSLDEIKGLCNNLRNAIRFMMVTGSNYGALVLQVFEAYKMMGSFCGIDESFKIDLFGRVSINELE